MIPTLSRAVRLIASIEQTRVLKLSSLYRTEAVGGPRQSDYLNGVVGVETGLSPEELMENLLGIEKKLGRVRREKWGPRVIDLDLLAMGRLIRQNKKITLPHPRYHLRRFVLVPFCDVASGFVHPILMRTNRTLSSKLTLLGQRVTIAASWNGTQFSLSNRKRKTTSPSSL